MTPQLLELIRRAPAEMLDFLKRDATAHNDPDLLRAVTDEQARRQNPNAGTVQPYPNGRWATVTVR